MTTLKPFDAKQYAGLLDNLIIKANIPNGELALNIALHALASEDRTLDVYENELRRAFIDATTEIKKASQKDSAYSFSIQAAHITHHRGSCWCIMGKNPGEAFEAWCIMRGFDPVQCAVDVDSYMQTKAQ